MKKIMIFLWLILFFIVFDYHDIIAVTVFPTDEIDKVVLEDNYVGADFKGGEFAYELENAIDSSINTFEACIRIEKNHNTLIKDSVIFGNYDNYDSLAYNTYASTYRVNVDGNICLDWCGEEYIFTSTDVRIGEWIHIAVVRDLSSKALKLYLDGKLIETINDCPTKELTNNFFEHKIGCGTKSNKRYPFLGEIGHIACYSSVRTDEEVHEDFNNVYDVNWKNRDNDLLFATMLELGDNYVYDLSKNFNNARLITNDYYYDSDWYEIVDYSFVAIGDTQKIAQYATPSFNKISEWIIDNHNDKKIATAMYMGDITEGIPSMSSEEWTREWVVAQNAIDKLNGVIPYMVIPGNHDYDENSPQRDLREYNKYFPYSKFATKENCFGGAYEVGQQQNTYYTMNLGGIDYIFIALEFGPNSKVMDWVCNVLEDYSDHRAVIMTHGFLDVTGELYNDKTVLSADWYFGLHQRNIDATSSREMWEKYLSKHDNVFMILCGHSVTETIAYKELKGEKGNTAMTFRIDSSYIVAGKALDSMIALFSFNENDSILSLNYFSAEKNMLYNVQNQMQIDFSKYTKLTKSFYEERRD